MTTDQQRLRVRSERIGAALEVATAELDPAGVTRAQDDLAALQERLRLGVDHTVVALLGGTGSGKSSMFNAISHLNFAEVGALRPTTQQAAACVWGSPATALLDFLEIDPSRRIARESELDAQDERQLHGLVLLDMPDHDSIEEAHSEQVDRLLPLADLLLWVVDPQKYADHALHSEYLRRLERRADAMIVLVNQIDTVPGGAVGVIEESLRELLIADGLPEVPIVMTSTATGEGVPDVRERLVDAVTRTSTAARTADAELAAVTERLRPTVATSGVELSPDVGRVACDDLARASGLGPVSDSLRRAARRLGAGSPPAPAPPARGTIEAVRSRTVHRAQEGLPAPWRRSIERDVSPVDRLQEALGEDLGAVELPVLQLRGPRRARVTGAVLAALGLLLVVVAGIITLGGGALPLPGGEVVALGGAVFVLGALLLAGAQAWLRRDAERLVGDYERRVREVIDDAVATHLLRPAEAVHVRHNELREALEG